MDDAKNNGAAETPAAAPAKAPAKAPEPEYFTLKAKPPKKKSKEDVEVAKKIANRYLGIQALEKIVSGKKARQKKLAEAQRFKRPETPEEFYERAQRYLNGAECSVPFQERALYYQKAAEMFAGAGDYSDAEALAAQYASLARSTEQEGYERAYAAALQRKQQAQSGDDWFEAARAFERIAGYKDADAQAAACQAVLDRRSNLRKPLLLLRVLLVLALFVGFVLFSRTDRFHYQFARACHRMGIDNVAAAFLATTEDYKDTERLLEEIYYDEGVERMEKGEYKKALNALSKCESEHPDLQERMDQCNYALGEAAFAEGHNKTAKDHFKACSHDYKDRQARIDECNYRQGLDALEQGDLHEAVSHFVSANGWADSDALRYEPELTLLRESAAGDKVFFGDTEYVVLEHTGPRFTLLRAGLIHDLPFHNAPGRVSWARSSLRAVLNGSEWLNESFSSEEQALLLPDASGDRVSLLTAADYLRHQEVMGKKDALWWLRDEGGAPDRIQFVSDEGAVMEDGYAATAQNIYVRPVISLELAEE